MAIKQCFKQTNICSTKLTAEVKFISYSSVSPAPPNALLCTIKVPANSENLLNENPGATSLGNIGSIALRFCQSGHFPLGNAALCFLYIFRAYLL